MVRTSALDPAFTAVVTLVGPGSRTSGVNFHTLPATAVYTLAIHDLGTPHTARNLFAVAGIAGSLSAGAGSAVSWPRAQWDRLLGGRILALLAEPTIAIAAKRCGVGERTPRRWITEDAAFQAELTAARRAAFDAGVQRVQALTAEAVETLADLLGEKKHSSVRLGAARAVLEMAVNRRDAETLLKRIEDLERWKPNTARPGAETMRLTSVRARLDRLEAKFSGTSANAFSEFIRTASDGELYDAAVKFCADLGPEKAEHTIELAAQIESFRQKHGF